jgi:Ca2+-binding RTX toxin-like protein
MSARSPFWSAQNAAELLADPQWQSPDGALSLHALGSLQNADRHGVLSQALTAGEYVDFITVDLTAGNSYRFVATGAAPADLAVFDSDGFMLVVEGAASGAEPSAGVVDVVASYTGRHVIGLRFQRDELGSWTLEGTEDIGADGQNNAPAVVSIAAGDADKREGQTGTTPYTFIITRSGPTSGAGSVAWAVEGSRVAISDFSGGVLPSGVVNFAAGETVKTVTVLVAGDKFLEADETFTVKLSAPSAGVELGTSIATGTIRNDDATLSISGPAKPITEGHTGTTPVTFTVTRTGDTGGSGSAEWKVAGVSRGASADGKDFASGVLPSGTVTFSAGETSKTITVSLVGDRLVEASEAFTVTLSKPSAGLLLGVPSVTAAISNDDIGTAGSDTLLGGSGAETLLGFAGADSLNGGDGNDLLDGGTGIDTLTGGRGDDTYVLDSAGDKVVEAAGGGIDLVRAALTITLSGNVENLLLTGSSGFAGTGNSSANLISGNAGANQLSGLAGADTLLGGGGADVLDGGSGADRLVGGTGNDRYHVDAAGDAVFERLGEGADTVISTVSWTLGENLEALQLDGTAGVAGTGNEFANLLLGNGGSNLLNGLGGNDTLRGGAGADTLAGGSGNDLLDGGTGGDRFVFVSAAGDADTITGFAHGSDLIAVSATGFGGGLVIGEDASFTSNTTGQSTSPAGTAQFIYETDTGRLWWDANGGGDLGLIIVVLAGRPAIGAGDLLVVA